MLRDAGSHSAGVIDSQSAKTTASEGVRGYDADKKAKGQKRKSSQIQFTAYNFARCPKTLKDITP
jgi:hypothetical protein